MFMYSQAMLKVRITAEESPKSLPLSMNDWSMLSNLIMAGQQQHVICMYYGTYRLFDLSSIH